MSNLKQLRLALIQYTQDNDENYPIAAYDNWGNSWPVLISPYVKAYSVYRCPDDASANGPGNGFWATDPGWTGALQLRMPPVKLRHLLNRGQILIFYRVIASNARQ